MSKKIAFLVFAAVTSVLFGLPAVASAGEWELDNSDATFQVTKVNSMTLRAANGDVVICTELSGTGTYLSKTTGIITLDWSGCIENTFGTKCQSGATAGTVTLTNKTFHNVIIGEPVSDGATPIGLLLTIDNASHAGGSPDVTFSCAGGLLSVKLTGNGVIGELESPNCGTAGTTFNLNFEPATPTSSLQKYRQITTTGTMYDLVSDIPSGGDSTSTSSLQETMQLHFAGSVTPTCS
ncbi:MAG TPA: hypothetical protein VFN92_13195 [Solirubrobacterales bacterium]|nr:hypothetical protein [Solirubrobacterales bacterium]